MIDNRFLEKLTNWELWPFKLRYLLISPVWLWYCIRSGSLWFFSSSNPTLTFGGFEGEGKKEMYDLLPEGLFPKTIYIDPADDMSKVKDQLINNKFSYPFVVKPEVGMKGLLFRKIDREEELILYHKKNPFTYIIQELIDYPLEVSVFYYRYPDKEKGNISGFLLKELMDVYGDGEKTLMELIRDHPKAKYRIEELRLKHIENMDKKIAKGERYILTYAANLNRGAQFTNLHHLIDDQLLSLFDKISHQAKFYYGRYDLKCTSVNDLKNQKNFMILEFNGSGAEPNHVYQSGFSLWTAYRVFLKHWEILYKISKYNNAHGQPYWPYLKGLRFLRAAKKHLYQLEKIDTQIPV